MKDLALKNSVLFLFVVTVFLGGGFFTYANALICILVIGILLVLCFRNHSLRIPLDFLFFALLLLALFSFAVPLWAVDSEMAGQGIVRYVTVFMFYILLFQGKVEQNTDKIFQELCSFLAPFGAAVTVLCLIMMQYTFFLPYISVAGRLAGPFQYPNTFSLFLLAAVISGVYEGMRCQEKARMYFYFAMSAVCCFGILFARSRGVLLAAAAVVLSLILFGKLEKLQKYRIFALLVYLSLFCVAGIIIFVFGSRSFRSYSTMWGRLLYDRDAISLILKRPLGLGYYGYYFFQGSIQSGVYNILNVHNEYLQLLIDFGLIPGIAVIVLIVIFIRKTKRTFLCNLILLSIGLHVAIDYDLQFLSIIMLALICLATGTKEADIKVIRIPSLGRILLGACAMMLAAAAFRYGAADAMYVLNQTDLALKFMPTHTLALENALAEAEESERAAEIGHVIAAHNPYDTAAYVAMAQGAYSVGDFDNFIINEKKAIETNPYVMQIYENYLDLLESMVNGYLANDDRESAAYALYYMEEVPDMLKKLESRTSALAWRIKDRPQLALSYEYLKKIEEEHEKVYSKVDK